MAHFKAFVLHVTLAFENTVFTTTKPGFGGHNFVGLSVFSGRRKPGVHALMRTTHCSSDDDDDDGGDDKAIVSM